MVRWLSKSTTLLFWGQSKKTCQFNSQEDIFSSFFFAKFVTLLSLYLVIRSWRIFLCNVPSSVSFLALELKKGEDDEQIQHNLYIGLSPLPVRVTTRIVTFLVGNPYKPSFPLLLGGGTTQLVHLNHLNLELCLFCFLWRDVDSAFKTRTPSIREYRYSCISCLCGATRRHFLHQETYTNHTLNL